jgi:hypothetical protein
MDSLILSGSYTQGTPKFIARSVAAGKLLEYPQYRTADATMPELHGRALDLYQSQSQAGNQYQTYIESVKGGTDPQETEAEKLPFSHKLFHDAESTFWVIAWTLARSAGQGYETEAFQKDDMYSIFIQAMMDHFTTPYDPRMSLRSSVSFWQEVLHGDLEGLAPMLSHMHRYIFPEWAYRDELDAEHVHEALMRLLLAEIVRIEDSNADIPLKYVCRNSPPSTHSVKASTSFQSSTSQSTSVGRAKGPTAGAGPLQVERQTRSVSGGRKRSRSQLGDSSSPKPRRSPRLAELQLGESGRSMLERLAPVAESVITDAKAMKWSVKTYDLEHP